MGLKEGRKFKYPFLHSINSY